MKSDVAVFAKQENAGDRCGVWRRLYFTSRASFHLFIVQHSTSSVSGDHEEMLTTAATLHQLMLCTLPIVPYTRCFLMLLTCESATCSPYQRYLQQLLVLGMTAIASSLYRSVGARSNKASKLLYLQSLSNILSIASDPRRLHAKQTIIQVAAVRSARHLHFRPSA